MGAAIPCCGGAGPAAAPETVEPLAPRLSACFRSFGVTGALLPRLDRREDAGVDLQARDRPGRTAVEVARPRGPLERSARANGQGERLFDHRATVQNGRPGVRLAGIEEVDGR